MASSLYSSLDLGDDTQKIRVLDLDPLRRPQELYHLSDIHYRYTQPLCGTLRVVSLNQHPRPRYAALSYVWRTESSSGLRRTIRCNNRDVEISENCQTALFRLRARFGGITVWVDSLCIDQEDTRERSHQVKLMGLIYSQAQTVYIWLSSDSLETEHMSSNKVKPSTDDGMLCLRRLSGRQNQPMGWGQKLDIQSPTVRDVNLLETLVRNEWFHRGWTFQELILASNPILLTSRFTLKWTDLCKAFETLQPEFSRTLNKPLRTSTSPLLGIASLVGVWKALSLSASRSGVTTRSMGRDRNLDCWGVIQSLRNRKVTETKDRAYALYGVLLALGAELARPDYRKSEDRVFKELFVDLLRWRPASLVLLLDASWKHNTNEPGWVPQWSNDAHTSWIPEDLICNATSGGEVHRYGSPIHEIWGSSLFVWGYLPGVVKHVFAVPCRRYSRGGSFNFDHDYLLSIMDWLREISGILDMGVLLASIITPEDLFKTVIKHIAPFMKLGENISCALEGWVHALFDYSYDSFGRCDWASWSLTRDRSDHFFHRFSLKAEATRFQAALQTHVGGRRALFITDTGRVGIGPYHTRRGDVSYYISGIPLPLMLREREHSKKFVVIGPTMIHNSPFDPWLSPTMRRIELV